MDTPKDHIESGAWVGRQQAFAVIASKCSAAQAAALKEIKQSRVYESLGLTWQEYCPRYAGMTRERADLLIRQFDEFGEATPVSRGSPASPPRPTARSPPKCTATPSTSTARRSN
jgi:hypothetical protein